MLIDRILNGFSLFMNEKPILITHDGVMVKVYYKPKQFASGERSYRAEESKIKNNSSDPPVTLKLSAPRKWCEMNVRSTPSFSQEIEKPI